MKQEIQKHFAGDYKRFYEKYLPKLEKNKAICPFHDDSTPSFFIKPETGQYYCQGCGKKGDIFHFYGKINGLDTRRDFGKVLRGIANDFGIPWEKQKSKLVKTYNYMDTDGKLLFQVCRMEPKDFRQRQPNNNGGWQWNLKGIEPVLYRMPELVTASEVLIVEGEKDSDNVCGLGFCATTSPMGAKKWRDEYSEVLKGKNVVLIPDNDNEGREHMAKVGASLNGYAASLKLLELPDLPSKGDVSDFLNIFTNKDDAAERLAVMIDNAKPYKPPKTYTIEDAILTTSQLCELVISERKSHLNPFLKESSIGMVFGDRGIGKSFFAEGIADAVTKNESFGPWECELPVPVLFLDGEMSIHDNRERIEALKLDTERKCPFYFYADAYANQLGLPRAHLANESWRKKIKRILTTRKVKLFIIDNLASLASGINENKKHEYDPINQWLLELRFAGISTMLLHHSNKEGGQRGTSAREDNLDYSIQLKFPKNYTPEDGARFIVHFSKSRVQTKYLSLIGDTEFHLTQDESDHYLWTFNSVKAERKREVLKMLDEGFDQKAISETLGISKGYVSQIKKKSITDGLLSKKGKLTQSGYLYVAETGNFVN